MGAWGVWQSRSLYDLVNLCQTSKGGWVMSDRVGIIEVWMHGCAWALLNLALALRML